MTRHGIKVYMSNKCTLKLSGGYKHIFLKCCAYKWLYVQKILTNVYTLVVAFKFASMKDILNAISWLKSVVNVSFFVL